MDEIEILQERQSDLLLEMTRQDLTKTEALAIIDELAEIETALQKLYAPIDTFADARLCARFGVGL